MAGEEKGRARGAATRGERGYNMVALVIGITILNILLAASLPLWSTAIRREKEEELIFRGLQYAEAIRVFHNRFSRYPPRLEDLLEVKPRSIRQLWKDPMTENGKWGLIFEGGQTLPVQPSEEGGGEDPGDTPEKSSFAPGKGTTVNIGPIVGVYSLSGKETVRLFNGQQQYNRWQFTPTMLMQGLPQHPGTGGAGQKPIPVRYIGRLPPFGAQGGTLPDGSAPVPVPGLNVPGSPTPGFPGQGAPRRPAGGDPNGSLETQ
jgi:type II secretory pathway pseudopilin PulG